MNQYKLVTIDLAFYAQLHLRLGNEQLLRKAGRGYVGLYDEKENWYIPIRSNLGKKKPSNACFPTPFQTSNPHFKNPGLDFQKAIYVPKEYTITIQNTMPTDQANFISDNEQIVNKNAIYSLQKNFHFLPHFPLILIFSDIFSLYICNRLKQILL